MLGGRKGEGSRHWLSPAAISLEDDEFETEVERDEAVRPSEDEDDVSSRTMETGTPTDKRRDDRAEVSRPLRDRDLDLDRDNGVEGREGSDAAGLDFETEGERESLASTAVGSDMVSVRTTLSKAIDHQAQQRRRRSTVDEAGGNRCFAWDSR